MQIGFRLEERFWLYVPPAFPADGFATREEWRQAAVARYLEAGPRAGDEVRARVEALVDGAHAAVAQGCDFGLQLWPAREPLALLFQVVGIDRAAGVDPLVALLDGIHLPAAPVVEEIEVPGADRAVIVKFLAAADPSDARANLAGLGAIVEYGGGAVLVRSEPTTSAMVGIAEGPLRDAVATFAPAPAAA